MKTSDRLFLDHTGAALFHDAVFEATGKSLDDDALRAVFDALPRATRALAHSWGLTDTPFRDQVCTYLRANPGAVS